MLLLGVYVPVLAAQTNSSVSISGQTINAITGQPVARALVHCGSQAMLTDFEGRFHCESTNTVLSIIANKPGYSSSEDASEPGVITLRQPVTDTPAIIRLYPEAVLTGTVTTPSGEPLPFINIQCRRSQYDDNGHHWIQMPTTRTDAHGDFRMPVSAGEYMLQTFYSPSGPQHAEAILPEKVPEETSSDSSEVIRVHSGETLHFNLQPVMASVFQVLARVEPDSSRGNVRIRAYMASGAEIYPQQNPTANPGEIRMELPSGTYRLEGRRQNFPEGLEVAETTVTIADQPLTGVLLRLAPVSPIPIELQVEPSPTSDNTPPNISQLGLSLESTSSSPTLDPNDTVQRPILRGSQQPIFNPPPGTYRLRSQGGGSWFVRAATCGSSDLLRQGLTVSPGAGASPIRLVVSNQSAGLSGTVRQNGQPASGWVYLISSSPSTTPAVILSTRFDGSYSRPNLPPGTYRAMAFEHRHSLNLEDPDTLAVFANELRSVTVAAGDKGTLDLEIVPFPGARP